SWQRGCMLQWRPGYDDQIVWNDRDGDRLVTRIDDVRRKKTRTIKSPFATLSPDGNTAWTVDFLRLFDARKGYGSPGEERSTSKVSLSDDGIFGVDMRKGERQLVVPLSTLVAYDRRFAAGNFEHF